VKDGVSFPPALANQPHPSGVRAPHPSSPYAALSRTLDDNCSSTPRDARQPVHLARLLSRLRLRCLCPAPRRLQKLRPAPARHPRRPRRRRPPRRPPRRASPAPLPTAPRCTPLHTTLAPLVRPVRHELPSPAMSSDPTSSAFGTSSLDKPQTSLGSPESNGAGMSPCS
jgi:hypothetical protein